MVGETAFYIHPLFKSINNGDIKTQTLQTLRVILYSVDFIGMVLYVESAFYINPFF